MLGEEKLIKGNLEYSLSEDTISQISKERLRGNFSVSCDGKPVVFNSSEPIGTGGTKEVYDVTIGDEKWALAVPSVGIDSSSVIKQKWEKVLKEADNTKLLREMGFYVNPHFEIKNILINQHSFPGVLMSRYEDIPFEIRDVKNKRSSTGKTPMCGEDFSQENIARVFGEIQKELASLIKNKVSLSRDSVNICIVDGVPHLYLNDLGSLGLDTIKEENIGASKKFHASCVVGAVIEALTEEEYQALQNSGQQEEFEKAILFELSK